MPPAATHGRSWESGYDLLILKVCSERALRAEPALTVECLSCRHVGVLTDAALLCRAITPGTPIVGFVKRLRCSKCGSRNVLAPASTQRSPRRHRKMKFLSTCGILLTVMAIAIVTSPLAYGQAKPSGPAVGGGDRTLIPSTQRAVTPQGGALSDLAGGGADPNYVPPGSGQKNRQGIAQSAPRVCTPRIALSNTAPIRLSLLDTIAGTALTSGALGAP